MGIKLATGMVSAMVFYTVVTYIYALRPLSAEDARRHVWVSVGVGGVRLVVDLGLGWW